MMHIMYVYQKSSKRGDTQSSTVAPQIILLLQEESPGPINTTKLLLKQIKCFLALASVYWKLIHIVMPTNLTSHCNIYLRNR